MLLGFQSDALAPPRPGLLLEFKARYDMSSGFWLLVSGAVRVVERAGCSRGWACVRLRVAVRGFVLERTLFPLFLSLSLFARFIFV